MSLSLQERIDALTAALEAGEGRLPEPVVVAARAVAGRAQERAGLSAEHTVVALAGATGSGKSSLFNALAGADLARVGVQRPTTAEAMAVVRGDGAEPLLDWLGVQRRHRLPAPASAPDGLVLLDLPDHDSVVTEHRLRADRLVQRADLLVWVVDPQKYADAALHEGYLRPLAGHSAVVVLVLNQSDRLAADQVRAVLADLHRLAAEDGLGTARTLAVSARTGAGVDELRRLLDEAAARRRAANDRWTADLRAAAARVVLACGAPGSVRSRPVAPDRLVDALAQAAGVPVVVDAVRRSAVRRLGAHTGWPPVRWVARLRPDPLRRLHLGAASSSDLVRTSLPAASAATRAAAATAVRDYADRALAGVPEAWVLAARDAVSSGDLPDELDRAVAGTPLLPDRSAGWARALGGLQWVLLAGAVAGLLWLAVLAGTAYLRLPEPRTPQWGPLPAPTALVIGGVVAGLVLAALGAVLARLAAYRRGRAAARRLRAAVARVARRQLVEPVQAVLDDLATCRERAARAAG